MLRIGAAALAAAALLVLAACGTTGGQSNRSAGSPPATASSPPDAALLADIPPDLLVPEEFDADGGFALRTATGGTTPDGAVRNTWEVTPTGVASYALNADGTPIIEATDFTSTSRWRVMVTDPLIPDPNPLLGPSLVAVLDAETTWLNLIERGSEAGTNNPFTRVTTYDSETGEMGGRASVPGADRGIGHRGANLVVFLDNGPDSGVGTVVIDPATGQQTRHDPVAGRDEHNAWNDTVLDVYQGAELVLRECTDAFVAGPCPSGLRYDGEWVSWPETSANTSNPGLTVTPGGVTLGDVDLATGRHLPTACGQPGTVTWSPSGRYAIVDGNVIDFRDDTSVCLGYYPRWTAISDEGTGYGTLENGQPARIDVAHGSRVTSLPTDTTLPLGIGAGGYGVFATDAAVLVLPPS